MNTETPNFQLLLNDVYGEEKAAHCTFYDICCVVDEIKKLGVTEKYILIEKYGLSDGICKPFGEISKYFKLTHPKLNEISCDATRSKFRKIMNYLKRELNPYTSTKGNFKITVEDFGLRAYNALRRNGITEFQQLAELTEEDLLEFENVGIGIVEKIKVVLSSVGLHLKTEYSETSDISSLLMD